MERGLTLICLFLMIISPLFSERSMPIGKQDSALVHIDSSSFIQSNTLYDALRNRSKKSNLSNLILKSIIVDIEWRNPNAEITRLVQEKSYYNGFRGRKIKRIHVFRSNIFHAKDSAISSFEKLHILTKEYIIRRNLFFKTGEILDAKKMVRNEQHLRSLSFLSDAYILLQENGEKEVDVFVYTRDNLSLSPGFRAHGGNTYYTYISESNIFGTGNKLEIGTIFSPQKPFYKGINAEYRLQNILGSFFDLDLLVYKNCDERNYKIFFNKEFLMPNDHAGGLILSNKVGLFSQFETNTPLALESNNVEIWVGKSKEISTKFGSIFWTSKYSMTHFPFQQVIRNAANADFYNNKELLFSTGVYYENFYRGSLIYGYGRSEDIPSGYKFEILGGYSRSQLGDRWYAGAKLSGAEITHFGFVNGSIESGSYYNRSNHQFEQSVVSINSNYFTNLIPIGRWGMRYFISTKYTHGFNRLNGVSEKLYFNSDYTPRTFLSNDSNGDNRLLISLEGTSFSPYYWRSFRFALYGFSDLAWLGYNPAIFCNDYYSSAGFGIRIKNERLIFQTIQIRIGFAIKKPQNSIVDWLNISDESRFRNERMTPGRASTIQYR